MIKVGITGGIGSGKSYVCEAFSRLGVPVFNADEEARVLTNTDPVIRQKLTKIFGIQIYSNDKLNRPLMAEMIFHNKSLLKNTNDIIHPRVAVAFKKWCGLHADKPYLLHESAILFESNAWRFFDKIIMVTAPETMRIERVIKRKNMTIEKVKAVLQNQLPEEEKAKRSDFVIVNDESMVILPKIIEIHHTLLSIC